MKLKESEETMARQQILCSNIRTAFPKGKDNYYFQAFYYIFLLNFTKTFFRCSKWEPSVVMHTHTQS